MSIQKTFYSSILFLLFTAGIYAQTLENKDSLAEESDIISDDKLKPLGDTTPVYIYYPLESQKLYKLDSSLNNFEYILANQLNLTEITKANKIILDEKAFEIIKETYCD